MNVIRDSLTGRQEGGESGRATTDGKIKITPTNIHANTDRKKREKERKKVGQCKELGDHDRL